MISDFTRNAIPQLVSHELEYSKNQHEEQFHSLHEAESVIREELEELEEHTESIRNIFNDIHTILRGGIVEGADLESCALGIMIVAENAAMEAVQLSAMGKKLLEWDSHEKAKKAEE